jgi:hypothetical protein
LRASFSRSGSGDVMSIWLAKTRVIHKYAGDAQPAYNLSCGARPLLTWHRFRRYAYRWKSMRAALLVWPGLSRLPSSVISASSRRFAKARSRDRGAAG